MLGWLWLQLMAAAMPTGRRVSVSHFVTPGPREKFSHPLRNLFSKPRE